MKYWSHYVLDFIFWFIAVQFSTILVWFIGGQFHLTYGKSLTIVTISYVLWSFNKTVDELHAITKREIRNDKFAEAIKDEVEKTLAANTEEAKLAEYRRTFGQSGKK